MTKNYVTIGIPEATRDKAQEDPRTYEEIMEAGLEHLDGDCDVEATDTAVREGLIEDIRDKLEGLEEDIQNPGMEPPGEVIDLSGQKVQLDASERQAIAREVAEELR